MLPSTQDVKTASADGFRRRLPLPGKPALVVPIPLEHQLLHHCGNATEIGGFTMALAPGSPSELGDQARPAGAQGAGGGGEDSAGRCRNSAAHREDVGAPDAGGGGDESVYPVGGARSRRAARTAREAAARKARLDTGTVTRTAARRPACENVGWLAPAGAPGAGGGRRKRRRSRAGSARPMRMSKTARRVTGGGARIPGGAGSPRAARQAWRDGGGVSGFCGRAAPSDRCSSGRPAEEADPTTNVKTRAENVPLLHTTCRKLLIFGRVYLRTSLSDLTPVQDNLSQPVFHNPTH